MYWVKNEHILSLFYDFIQKSCTEEKLLTKIQIHNEKFPNNITKNAVDETYLRIVKVYELGLKWISIAETKIVIKTENLDTGIDSNIL
jgi:hypothetical protein